MVLRRYRTERAAVRGPAAGEASPSRGAAPRELARLARARRGRLRQSGRGGGPPAGPGRAPQRPGGPPPRHAAPGPDVQEQRPEAGHVLDGRARRRLLPRHGPDQVGVPPVTPCTFSGGRCRSWAERYFKDTVYELYPNPRHAYLGNIFI